MQNSSFSPKALLQKNFLFSEFNELELQKASEQSRQIHLKKGETIEALKACPNEIALITKGRLESFYTMEGDNFHLGILYSNDVFNGPALIERTSSQQLRALEDTSLLLIKNEIFKNLEKTEKNKFLQLIKKAYAHSINSREALNDQLIITIERTNGLLNRKDFSSHYLCIVTLFFFLFLFSLDLIKYLSFNLLFDYQQIISAGSIFIFSLVIGYLVQTSNKSYSYFGIHSKNYKKHIVESLIFTAIVLFSTTLLKAFAIYFHILPEDKNLFEFKKVLSNNPWYGFVFYCLLVPVQQFIIRSGFQVPLQTLLAKKNNSNIRAITLSSIAFGALHITFGIITTFIMIPMGFLWSILFDRQQGLIGVSVSHVILGLWTIIALDVFGLFH